MKSRIEEITIGSLLEYHKNSDLKPNWEYQRGLVWNEDQMRLLIDSILRGYTIPLIYIHEKMVKIAGKDSFRLEIIDGQQRINTFAKFTDDCINPLFDPMKPEGKKKFPVSMHDIPVTWAGKRFSGLGSDLQDKFMNTKVLVVYIECSDDEARDLFIRLQGGRALTPQEVRDSRPGDFCEQILKIGGKLEIHKPGHDFFRHLTSTKAGDVRTRQLVAQVLMLFLLRQDSKKDTSKDYFTTIKSGALDEFYIQKVNLENDKDKIDRFNKVLDLLYRVFFNKTSPMKVHTVIHLVLFVDMLMGSYAPAWEDHILGAHKQFMSNLAKVKKDYKNDFPQGESEDVQLIWHYDSGTRRRADGEETIRERHKIYSHLMIKYMGDGIKPLDPKRAYTHDDREYIFYRDKVCSVCGGNVSWDDAEIHHKTEHFKGGQTTLENGTLVHKKCHPRGRPKKGA